MFRGGRIARLFLDTGCSHANRSRIESAALTLSTMVIPLTRAISARNDASELALLRRVVLTGFSNPDMRPECIIHVSRASCDAAPSLPHREMPLLAALEEILVLGKLLGEDLFLMRAADGHLELGSSDENEDQHGAAQGFERLGLDLVVA